MAEPKKPEYLDREIRDQKGQKVGIEVISRRPKSENQKDKGEDDK